MLRALHLLILSALFVIGVGTAHAADADLDGVDDSHDNCTALANPDQLDSDTDGYGDRCDGDYDNDGVVDQSDYAFLQGLLSSQSFDPKADHDGNGMVTAIDAALFLQIHGKPPGPSGMACAGSSPCPAS
jgi:hypothetical protein